MAMLNNQKVIFFEILPELISVAAVWFSWFLSSSTDLSRRRTLFLVSYSHLNTYSATMQVRLHIIYIIMYIYIYISIHISIQYISGDEIHPTLVQWTSQYQTIRRFFGMFATGVSCNLDQRTSASLSIRWINGITITHIIHRKILNCICIYIYIYIGNI